MKKATTLAAFLIFSIASLSAQGILNRLEKKAKNKLNDRIEQKADEKMDETLDKAFEESDKTDDTNNSSSSASDSAAINNLAMRLIGRKNFAECNAKPSYSFNAKMVVDMYSVGKKAKDSFSMRYNWYLSSDNNQFGMENVSSSQNMESVNGSKLIMDFEDSCVITLIESDGNKISMSMKYNNDEVEKYADSSKVKKPKKTGKTKTINGKKCYEYVFEDKETYQQLWVEESKVKLWDMNENDWSPKANFMKDGKQYGSFFDAMPLETLTKDKKSGTVTTMFVRSIDKNVNSTISTVGYTEF
jgi:hypothetical protein